MSVSWDGLLIPDYWNLLRSVCREDCVFAAFCDTRNVGFAMRYPEVSIRNQVYKIRSNRLARRFSGKE